MCVCVYVRLCMFVCFNKINSAEMVLSLGYHFVQTWMGDDSKKDPQRGQIRML